jgi:hypothetical protein
LEKIEGEQQESGGDDSDEESNEQIQEQIKK